MASGLLAGRRNRPLAAAFSSRPRKANSAVQEKQIHQIFEVSILIKGAHALIECACGIVLAFVSTSSIVHLVNRLTQEELVQDPRDFLAAHLLGWAQTFSVQTQHFYAFYLLSHGVAKLLLVAGLLREKHWAYPASLAVLGLFITYQLYRYSYTHSVGLIVLTVFDVIVIGLIWHEYRLVRRHLPVR
jgi:uncharacterized membrane protein